MFVIQWPCFINLSTKRIKMKELIAGQKDFVAYLIGAMLSFGLLKLLFSWVCKVYEKFKEKNF